MQKFKDKYGVIKKVSDKDYFTNSIHVPVYDKLDAFEKIDIESQLDSYSNSGCILYVELDATVKHNIDAIEKIVVYAMDKDVPYFAINVPNDTCNNCGYTDEINVYKKEKESIIFDDFTLDSKFVDFPYMVKSSAIKILTLKDKNNNNLRFNYELLSNHKFNMLGHARHYISVVQPEEILTTNKSEQDKIASIMTNIDNLITLHQRKLDKLNNFKKSMLEKMFV